VLPGRLTFLAGVFSPVWLLEEAATQASPQGNANILGNILTSRMKDE
jgi:hypothetical protein